MTSIVINPDIAAQLSKCRDTVELRDREGRVIGLFEPSPRIYDEGEIPEFDEEELKRRVERWQGIPSADVRRWLENLK